MRKLTIATALLAISGLAFAHDYAEHPHLRCEINGSSSLLCLYDRHATTQTTEPRPHRPSRVGYADKGMYEFSCATSRSQMAIRHRTSVCRKGTGTLYDFQCWTVERRSEWLVAAGDEAEHREAAVEQYILAGKPLQDAVFKLLTDPALIGRQHFLFDDDTTEDSVREYATHCDLETDGNVSLAELQSSIPLRVIEVFFTDGTRGGRQYIPTDQ